MRRERGGEAGVVSSLSSIPRQSPDRALKCATMTGNFVREKRDWVGHTLWGAGSEKAGTNA